MGVFRDLGKKVERFKQEVESTAADQADFECAECGERFYTFTETCPNCGSADIETLDEES